MGVLNPIETELSCAPPCRLLVPRDMFVTLTAAVLSKSEDKLSSNELLNTLSAYASAGIADLRQLTEGKSRTEIYEFLLGQPQT